MAAVVGSFLPFYRLDNPIGADDTISAWGDGLFPTATLVTLFATATAALVVLARLRSGRLRAVVGFGPTQLHLALGFFATVVALTYLFVDTGVYGLGAGYYLLLAGATATLAGAVLTTGTPPAVVE